MKNLHHLAAKKYDIGVYFEANGHGTVLFSDLAKESIISLSKTKETQKDLQLLLGLVDLINETVGDAISDMLVVEAVLRLRGWSLQQWNAQYTDIPNRLFKVVVKDRTIFQTTNAEQQVVKPQGLQPKIDALVKEVPKGRSFVRPSGTEDVVRVYAEADTIQNCQKLLLAVAELVYADAGGVGAKPKL